MANNNKYIDQYKRDHYGRVTMWLPKEEKERWQAEAKKAGMNLTEYIRSKVNGQ